MEKIYLKVMIYENKAPEVGELFGYEEVVVGFVNNPLSAFDFTTLCTKGSSDEPCFRLVCFDKIMVNCFINPTTGKKEPFDIGKMNRLNLEMLGICPGKQYRSRASRVPGFGSRDLTICEISRPVYYKLHALLHQVYDILGIELFANIVDLV